MTADPTDPDIVEDTTDIPETEADDQSVDISVEAPEADTAEQRADIAPPQQVAPTGDTDNADEGDLAEQARIVELDEDDYR